MKKHLRGLIVAALCSQAICNFPSQVLAGDGGVVSEEVTEYQGDDNTAKMTGTNEYVPGVADPVEVYDGNAGRVSDAVPQEDWDNVTVGDWQQDSAEENIDASVPVSNLYDNSGQEIIHEEVTNYNEQFDNSEMTVEEYNTQSESAVPVFESETKSEMVDDINNSAASVMGDINGDGVLNVVDCALLQKYIQGKQDIIDMEQADFNGDDQISMLDVHAMLNIIKSEGKGTGDINGDGIINSYDIQVLTSYLARQTANVNRQNADLDGDGELNRKDLMILREVVKVRAH